MLRYGCLKFKVQLILELVTRSVKHHFVIFRFLADNLTDMIFFIGTPQYQEFWSQYFIIWVNLLETKLRSKKFYLESVGPQGTSEYVFSKLGEQWLKSTQIHKKRFKNESKNKELQLGYVNHFFRRTRSTHLTRLHARFFSYRWFLGKIIDTISL